MNHIKPTAPRYFGLHFDFHAKPAKDPAFEVGANVDRAMVRRILDTVRPDYVQCDCKGHPGWSSYATKVGYPVPGLVGDPLRVWREETAAHGVALYVHLSGIWDQEVCRRHPEWAAVDAEGSREHGRVSVFSRYAEEHLVPQLVELATDYKIDGAWIDGESWAVVTDYSEQALQAWKSATGKREAPRPEDADFPIYVAFNREGFRRYVARYTEALAIRCPEFQICSNWLYSYYMPEKPVARVAFLSGDFTFEDPVNSARWAARMFDPHGLPWDLMAWGFKGQWSGPSRSYKTALQLKQEAAVVIAQGGGFQAYYKQRSDATVEEWPLARAAEVGDFVRARRLACEGSSPFPQAALLFATEAYYAKLPKPFECWKGEQTFIKGILNALLQGGRSVDIIYQYQIETEGKDYPLLIIPEWSGISDTLREQLLHYTTRGGKLLLMGVGPLQTFADALGLCNIRIHPKEVADVVFGEDRFTNQGDLATFDTPEELETTHLLLRRDGATAPAALYRPYGSGAIAVVCFDFGHAYAHGRTCTARDFLRSIADRLHRPAVRVTGSHQVDVVLRQKNGAPFLHLINTSGPHDHPENFVFDEITPLGPLNIEWDLPQRPSCLVAEPAAVEVDFTYENGVLRFTLPSLEIHTAFLPMF